MDDCWKKSTSTRIKTSVPSKSSKARIPRCPFTLSSFFGKNSLCFFLYREFRTFYKAKKLVGIGSAKNYSDFESSTAVYEKYATKVNQILKVGLKDYIVAHSFASLLSKTIKSSELVKYSSLSFLIRFLGVRRRRNPCKPSLSPNR